MDCEAAEGKRLPCLGGRIVPDDILQNTEFHSFSHFLSGASDSHSFGRHEAKARTSLSGKSDSIRVGAEAIATCLIKTRIIYDQKESGGFCQATIPEKHHRNRQNL